MATLLAAILGSMCGSAASDVVCPDSSYVETDYACVYTGTYRNGSPLDVITVSPDGSGETFLQNGIRIRVFLRDCKGVPLAGVPAEQITLNHDFLCACAGGNVADAATDENGYTAFSGTLSAGGCVTNLELRVEGTFVCQVPVGTNSPDDFFAAPCIVGADEAAAISGILGDPAAYTICFDFNEDGSVDATDWAIVASRYWSDACVSGSHEQGRNGR